MEERDYEVLLPKLGESIVSATVVQWFKKEGEHVALDEPLLEVSTDKVNSEIPAPVAGFLKKILAQPDQELLVGEVLAIVESHLPYQVEPLASFSRSECEKVEKINQTPSTKEILGSRFSPAIVRLAQEHQISLADLEKIPGTGTAGRLSKHDLELYIQEKSTGIEYLKMTGIRKITAESMVRSFYEAPHATLITEYDLTNKVSFIQSNKDAFFTKYGIKLTITGFVAHAVVRGLLEFPYSIPPLRVKPFLSNDLSILVLPLVSIREFWFLL